MTVKSVYKIKCNNLNINKYLRLKSLRKDCFEFLIPNGYPASILAADHVAFYNHPPNMKKLFYLIVGIVTLSCDADRTELPGTVDLEIPTQNLTGRLYDRVVLEVTLRRPISGSPDTTYVEVKNVSGKALSRIGFYLESCQQADSEVQGCAPDYYFSFDKAASLKNDSVVVDKVRRFVDFEYTNKIYITVFKSDTTTAPALAMRYLYPQIKKTVEMPTDTLSYIGSGKVYVQTDGTFFCRGNIFGENESESRQIRLSGSIAKNNQVYVKDLMQPAETLPFLFLGNVTNQTLTAKAKITNDSAEIVEILLK